MRVPFNYLPYQFKSPKKYFIGWKKHVSQQKPKLPGSAKKKLSEVLSKK